MNDGLHCAFQISCRYFQLSSSQSFEFVGIQFLDHFSFVNDADACGEPVYFGQDVTRHKDGHSVFVDERSQQLAYFNDAGRVESVGGFVEDQQFGRVK